VQTEYSTRTVLYTVHRLADLLFVGAVYFLFFDYQTQIERRNPWPLILVKRQH
jgi:hypothetical protein